MTFSVCGQLHIEEVDEGALVFDSTSGATTLIGQNAKLLLDSMSRLGTVDEPNLVELCSKMREDGSELSSILASLEASRLVFRC